MVPANDILAQIRCDLEFEQFIDQWFQDVITVPGFAVSLHPAIKNEHFHVAKNGLPGKTEFPNGSPDNILLVLSKVIENVSSDREIVA
jgi:hypothetical protein